MSSSQKKGKSYKQMMHINNEQNHYNNKVGILISHALKRDRGAKKELSDLFSRFIDDETQPTVDSNDIDAQLAAEVEALNKKVPIHDTGVECMLFAEVPINAIEAVQKMFDGAKEEGIVIKEIQKIVPLQYVSIASSMDKLIETFTKGLEKIDAKQYKTFAIHYNCRHNSNFTRDLVIKTLADMVPKEWKVDITKAEMNIYVEIFNRGLGVSFIEKNCLKQIRQFQYISLS
ncbi:THUMP domain-containing protein [Entamoeba marina]